MTNVPEGEPRGPEASTEVTKERVVEYFEGRAKDLEDSTGLDAISDADMTAETDWELDHAIESIEEDERRLEATSQALKALKENEDYSGVAAILRGEIGALEKIIQEDEFMIAANADDFIALQQKAKEQKAKLEAMLAFCENQGKDAELEDRPEDFRDEGEE